MTRELIENIRAIIVPYMAYDLRRINYENMGEIDAEQFKEDMNEILDLAAKALEQQPSYNPDEWCHDCSEYDHEKHCCPRYNKVIRNTVEEMKQEQEPCDKCEVGNPCLYCKHEFETQESEDRELEQEPVLDKIRAEIEQNADRLKDSLYGDGLRHALEIIDKYRAESGETNVETIHDL